LKYYAARCKKCGRYSGLQCKETQLVFKLFFRCKFCNTKARIKKKSEYGLSMELMGPYNSVNISKAVAKLNKKDD